jgi:fibronectin type 3 domain-containing protein
MSKNGAYAVSSYDTTGRCVQLADTPVVNGATYVKGGVNIDWEEAQGAVKYRVFVKYGNKSWTKLADTTDTTFTHKTGKNGRVYTYTVRCVTASGKTYVSAYDKTGVTIKFKK